jgi:hypothetical protein
VRRPQRVAGEDISGPPGASVQSSVELMRFATMGDMDNAPYRLRPGFFPACSNLARDSSLTLGLRYSTLAGSIEITFRQSNSTSPTAASASSCHAAAMKTL